ncbi:C-type lectin domain-containing protein [Geminocystis sp.]|uniref:C-type lectin domain-containing protein n=1 Tax=Geminocystis sp. TaxID=2664100 RepID=UPI0035940B7F
MKPNYFYLMALLTTTIGLLPKVVSSQESKIINPDNGHQYFLTDIMSWQEAKILAEKLGGYLVTINDSQENEWLVKTFIKQDTDFLWIGLTDFQEEGHFIWSNGQEVTYINWSEGEPNNNPLQGGEDFAVLNGFNNPFNRLIGSWSDAPEKAKLRGIVEIPLSN